MSDHEVFMGTTQAHAYLGTGNTFHTFRFNPDNAQWDYKENTMSYDTIGGRVVQLLSVQISGLTVTGRAGSRGELQRLAENVRRIMEHHIKTSQAVTFRVPSRQWDFRVYVQAMPQVGWDVASTSYPYSLQLAVEEDVSGLQSQKLGATALTRLAENIGYKKAFHGGEAAGFQKVVNTLLAATGGNTNGGGGGGGGGGANVGPNVAATSNKFGDLVVSTAKSFLGSPYLLDGSSTSGIDCSGLVMRSYESVGILLPHSAAQQQTLCVSLGTGTAAPKGASVGDLIFMEFGETSTKTDAGHVAIYLGKNQTIESAPSHNGVGIAPLGYQPGPYTWGRPQKAFKK